MEDFFYVILFFVLLAISIVVYFIPTIVSRKRGHKDKLAVTVLNIFAGWTLLGWIIALVWACTGENTGTVGDDTPLNTKMCLNCGTIVDARQAFCQKCGNRLDNQYKGPAPQTEVNRNSNQQIEQ